MTQIYEMLIELYRKHWFLCSLLLILLVCRTVCWITFTPNLKSEGLKIVALTKEWWLLPKEQGGGGGEHLVHNKVTPVYEHGQFSDVSGSIATYVGKNIDTPNTNGAFNDIWNKNGSFSFSILENEPDKIKIRGGKANRYFLISVWFEITIDLTEDLSDVKIKTKRGIL